MDKQVEKEVIRSKIINRLVPALHKGVPRTICLPCLFIPDRLWSFAVEEIEAISGRKVTAVNGKPGYYTVEAD
jgi:hypothetical protein